MNKYCLTELNDLLSESLDALGFTLLTRFPTVRLWRQVESRLACLYRIEIAMTTYWHSKEAQSLSILEQHKFATYMFGLANMKAYCQSVRSQLDINNTIDHKPTGDLSYSLKPHADEAIFKFTVEPFTPLCVHWSRYWTLFPEKAVWDLFSDYVEKPAGFYDEAAKLLIKSTYASRRSTVMARLQWELKCRHEAGWFFIFDTLTLSPDMVKAFYETPNALRHYFRNVGRSVLRAESRSIRQSSDDCYSYFCCPEYGSERGRLHFHVIHFCRTLPRGSVDPNYGRRDRTRRQIDSFRGFWPYGTTTPIAVRYSKDAFTRLGWLWPTDKKGVAIDAKPYIAVGFYVTKYVCKNVDILQNANIKSKEAQKWKTQINLLVPSHLLKHFRIRMSRNLGNHSIPMHNLSVEALLQIMRLHHTVSPYQRILKKQSKRELLNRASTLTVAVIHRYISQPTNLLKSLRSMMKTTPECSLPSFIASIRPCLPNEDISNEVSEFLRSFALDTASAKAQRGTSRTVFGSK